MGKDGWDVPSGGVEALDELLDLPHLDVLLRWILTHLGSSLQPVERPLCVSVEGKKGGREGGILKWIRRSRSLKWGGWDEKAIKVICLQMRDDAADDYRPAREGADEDVASPSASPSAKSSGRPPSSLSSAPARPPRVKSPPHTPTSFNISTGSCALLRE